MSEKFIVTKKENDPKDEKTVLISLRMETELRDSFDRLAKMSKRSRSELMVMAMHYALEHLEFLPDGNDG